MKVLDLRTAYKVFATVRLLLKVLRVKGYIHEDKNTLCAVLYGRFDTSSLLLDKLVFMIISKMAEKLLMLHPLLVQSTCIFMYTAFSFKQVFQHHHPEIKPQ